MPESPLASHLPCSNVTSPPAGVVLLQAEDSVASTIKPDLVEWGANLQRVFVYEPSKFGSQPLSLPGDMKLVRDAVTEVDAKLLVIDPVAAFYSCNAKPSGFLLT